VSGSGKSVGASHITAQLCRLATHTKKESRVASQLQQAQQILDAFGCAYTKDNKNASMFSKFLEIQVHKPHISMHMPQSLLSLIYNYFKLTQSILPFFAA
jgi:myosin heavy subunit